MRVFLVIVCWLLSGPVYADFKERHEIKQLFAEAGMVGTFVLFDSHANTLSGHNKSRAVERFIPASTFKIAHSIIGLSVGAVSSVDEILPYGGGQQFLKVWEQDMSLRSAIKVSNVPVYQGMARRIGLEHMQRAMTLLAYGNKNIGQKLDRFWLEGPLEISAVEQVHFLSRLALGQLPVRPDIQKAVRDIALLEEGTGWALYGKTGFTTTPDPNIGWWVGWLEQNNRVHSFALNVDAGGKVETQKRVALGKESLKALGLL